MTALLDTHVLIWLIEDEPHRLPKPHRDLLRSAQASLGVSVVSFWEIKLKVEIGRLSLRLKPADLPDYCARARLSVIPVRSAHVLADVAPLPATRDPFDRLLLAQAQVEGLRLMTLDRALAGHPLAWQPAG